MTYHQDKRKTSMSEADMKAELEKLRAENDRLKSGATRAISMKVSEKGALSFYGLGRFPVTLYKEQWLKLLDRANEIKSFIQENDSKLKAKGS
jgi:hypothetical protein